ncbi:MAG TPA: hypothetical protein VFI94_12855 [Pseudolabrys sp.]|nr:hypothetical protein [Pseudolabrys sp.]
MALLPRTPSHSLVAENKPPMDIPQEIILGPKNGARIVAGTQSGHFTVVDG